MLLTCPWHKVPPLIFRSRSLWGTEHPSHCPYTHQAQDRPHSAHLRCRNDSVTGTAPGTQQELSHAATRDQEKAIEMPHLFQISYQMPPNASPAGTGGGDTATITQPSTMLSTSFPSQNGSMALGPGGRCEPAPCTAAAPQRRSHRGTAQAAAPYPALKRFPRGFKRETPRSSIHVPAALPGDSNRGNSSKRCCGPAPSRRQREEVSHVRLISIKPPLIISSPSPLRGHRTPGTATPVPFSPRRVNYSQKS